MGNSAIGLSARIYVAGHRGMVGSALVRRLAAGGYTNLLLRSRAELDLLDAPAVHAFLQTCKPDFIFMAAAHVGGIGANTLYGADFIYENLAMQTNLIHGAHAAGVPRLMFLGSSCIYPREAPQPINEDSLLTGKLEPTNEPYAVAKIAGVKMCEAYQRQYGRGYFSVMPSNLYGPNDNYDPQDSHVIPALMLKAHRARLDGADGIVVWGSGAPRREFLHVDDLADACVHLMELGYDGPLVNIGCGADQTVAELAHKVVAAVGCRAAIRFDTSKPDGVPRKLLDISRITALGWQPRIGLEQGLVSTYRSFLEQQAWLERHDKSD